MFYSSSKISQIVYIAKYIKRYNSVELSELETFYHASDDKNSSLGKMLSGGEIGPSDILYNRLG